jgi:hypothetical protein
MLFLVRIAGHLRRDARVAVFMLSLDFSVINVSENCKKEGPATVADGTLSG